MAFLSVQAVFLLVCLICAELRPDEKGFDEYSVKAAFLFNLAKFVEWPDQAFKSSEAQFVICILGQSPFASVMRAQLQDKLVGSRPVEVRGVPDTQNARGCHILFVSASERKNFGTIFTSVNDSPVLTVGESQEFIAFGGMINLMLKDTQFHIQINPGATETEHLRISSRLMSLAEITRK